MANLGSLSNIPKASSDINKRICVVYGDICQLKTDAIVVPMNACELSSRVHALAGEELKASLQRQTVPLGEAGQTPAFGLQKDGYPNVIFHCNVPVTEDTTSLKQAYDRAFSLSDYAGTNTMAAPILAGVSYPVPGQDYYPLLGAVHVMLSSIRAQFEKAKTHQLTLIVIVCANEREKSVVNDLMELYFPHDPENEIDDDLVEPVQIMEVKEEKKKKGKGKGKKKEEE